VSYRRCGNDRQRCGEHHCCGDGLHAQTLALLPVNDLYAVSTPITVGSLYLSTGSTDVRPSPAKQTGIAHLWNTCTPPVN
jgi:hypothetical protein